ncbi:NADPH-ferrihemoprotein reductase [Babesia microti strain RI]|uniref:NADPH-ferrihemoprotein reductase n=1 Tax=Babesia microti (strain RI) TaxID=1133968 RepID=A0A0K3ARY8_BABMR|nr:NADPH-ferrihemoprotein reductase [Babesia microti strain RI]CTQ41398.1 NADPH-ferrihemoprotein reductase [Babesia microti strain RI]|eukprot:XP_012649409.1 NADPH-ferrihemoprotein reductase [Babesia microti strain RI]
MTIGIVFGSDGGHARDCAIDIYHHIDASNDVKIISSPVDFEDYEILIFIVSTGGHGAFPRKFIPLWNKLSTTKKIKTFCIFGLGDSRYRNYNYAARKLQSRMESIGTELIPLCLGDDQDPLGFRAMFEPWKTQLFEALNIIPKLRFPCIFTITAVNDNKFDGQNDFIENLIQPITNCTLVRHDVIVDNFDRKVTELDIKLDSQFKLGDVLAVYYQVDKISIDKFINNFNLSDIVVDLVINDANYSEMGYERITSGKYKLSTLLKHYFDIKSIVSPWMMMLLSKYALLDLHRDKLHEFGTTQGLYLFNKYVEYERRSLIDVIIDFDSITLTLEQLINIIPPLSPRLYSIANSPGCILPPLPMSVSYQLMFNKARLFSTFTSNVIANYTLSNGPEIGLRGNKRIAQLCVALVENYTVSGRKVLGNCSNWLIHTLKTGDMFFANILPCCISNDIRNAIINKPCIFLSTGTGFSSCRPWLQYKLFNSPSEVVKNLVIVGFRRRRNDLLFSSEWYLYSRIAKIDIAYSREMSANGSHLYIQNLLPKHSEIIWKMLLKGSIILISGRSHPMPSQILDTLVNILIGFHFTVEQARLFVYNLESSDRIIFDTW